MTTPPFDPAMPDPFNLQKKTVKLPNPTDYIGHDPLLFELARDHAAAQEDRNLMLASMQWNNRATGEMFNEFRNRLNDGSVILNELRVIRRVFVWTMAGMGTILAGSGTILLADWVSHFMGWK